jgi:hypothetical protein
MKKFFSFLVARRLTRTPLGLAVLAAGWLLSRRRRQHKEQQRESRR